MAYPASIRKYVLWRHKPGQYAICDGALLCNAQDIYLPWKTQDIYLPVDVRIGTFIDWNRILIDQMTNNTDYLFQLKEVIPSWAIRVKYGKSTSFVSAEDGKTMYFDTFADCAKYLHEEWLKTCRRVPEPITEVSIVSGYSFK
jgi:hypothetical protein